MDISKIIKSTRELRGMTQKQLAEKSGISEISIRKYESGDRKPKLEKIKKLANALSIPTTLFDPDYLDVLENHDIESLNAVIAVRLVDIIDDDSLSNELKDRLINELKTQKHDIESYLKIYEQQTKQTLSFAEYLEKAKAGNLSLTDLFDMWLQANEIEWKRAQRYGKQGREFTFEDFTEESYFVTESQFKIIRKGNIEYAKSRIREFDESNKDSQD